MVQNSKGMGANLSLSTLPSPSAWVTSCPYEPKAFDFCRTGQRLRDTVGSRKLKGQVSLAKGVLPPPSKYAYVSLGTSCLLSSSYTPFQPKLLGGREFAFNFWELVE